MGRIDGWRSRGARRAAWAALGAPARSGALVSVSTQDAHGAELVLDEQGPSR